MKHTREWDSAESPLLWVEAIYAGDILKMPELLGFKYGGHYFVCENQTVTFYMSVESENAAKEYGAIKYSDPLFIKYFFNKSEEIEKELNGVLSKIKDLEDKNDEELLELYKKLFDKYSAIAAIYRFSRPDFYEKLVKDLREKLQEPKDENLILLLKNEFEGLDVDPDTKRTAKNLKLVGEKRFEMHKTWMRAFKESKRLFKEIGKRVGLSSLEVQNSTSDEIINSLSGKELDKEKIRKRIKYFRFVYNEDSFDVLTDKDEVEKEEIANEIKGISANPGKVKGKVIILTESLIGVSSKELEKMSKGNILVTNMTSPDMMIACKKAGAIVTNDGGMLCHAAIVSRELGIPCVIGTKIATKILKDGDLIEVDAEKGIINILKKA